MIETDLKECEVVIKLEVPKDKLDDLYVAIAALNKLGIYFDTGGCSDNKIVQYDLEFDWSLKGAKVFFKRFKNE